MIRPSHAAAAVTALLAAAPAAVAAWQQPVAAPIAYEAGRDAQQPSLAVIAGVPYAAWTERGAGTNRHIRVARLENGAWRQVGISRLCQIVALVCSPLNRDDAADAIEPSITGVAGRPWVVWREFDGVNWEVRVARLTDAGTWERVADGPSPLNRDPAREARTPDIADVGGVPYVSWSESSGTNSNDVIVARLQGGAWQRVGDRQGGLDQNQVIWNPDLEVIDGVPHVSWMTSAGFAVPRVMVARMNATGDGWDALPPLTVPSLAIEHDLVGVDGAPWVAYLDGTGRTTLRVARYVAGGWGAVGGGPLNVSAGNSASTPRLSAVGGTAWVTWSEAPQGGAAAEAHVARLTQAGTWTTAADPAGPSVAGRSAFTPAVAAAGPVPMLAWVERETPGGTLELRVARLVPDVLSQTAVPGTGSAGLFAQIQTWGLPVSAGFEFGPAGALAPTPATDVPAGGGVVTVTQPVTGLAAGAPYSWRTLLRVGDLTVRGADVPLTLPAPPGAPGPATTVPRTAATPPPVLRCRTVRGIGRCTVTLRTTLARGVRVRARLLSGRRVLATTAPLRVGARGRLVIVLRPRTRPSSGGYVLQLLRVRAPATVLRRVTVRVP